MTQKATSPKRSFQLLCHSPLIHFQADEGGATLRASEVKPKLDTYLISKLKPIKREWYVQPGKNQALNYRMKIIHIDASSRFKQEDKIIQNFPIFYGKGKKLVLSDPLVTITCFIPDLLEAIEEHIADFFIVTNFGTMQHKGFGSFTITEKTLDSQKIGQILGERYHSDVYKMKVPGSCRLKFQNIQNFYRLTKSGINGPNADDPYCKGTLFRYMHDKGIGNEKARLKSGIVKPLATKHFESDDANAETPARVHYVRSVLGMTSNFSFPNNFERTGYTGPKRYVQRVLVSHKTIKRYASPLRFKVIDDSIYIYLVSDSIKRLLDEKGTFAFRRRVIIPEKLKFNKGKELLLPLELMDLLQDNNENELLAEVVKIKSNKDYMKIRERLKKIIPTLTPEQIDLDMPKSFDGNDFLGEAVANYNQNREELFNRSEEIFLLREVNNTWIK